ncbi:hypothetical protein IT417_00690 [bacterium]|nr:hypothetical protein [bacterium]
METFSRLLKTTKDNITRNRWLSISTILVVSIVFTLSAFFIGTGIIAQKAVKYYEKKAQVIVFFKQETPEEEIFKFRDKINDTSTVDNIEYISKEKALEQYKADFINDPDLVDTLSTDTLPPSLGIRAKSAQDLETVVKTINEEREKNAYIDDVMYFRDVLSILSALSKGFNIGVAALILGLGGITFALIMIGIGFNILAHKDEIEIMDLVGSPAPFIKVPFLIEGAIYGLTGSFLASSLILFPWYTVMHVSSGSDFHFWISSLLNELSLGFLSSFDLKFTLIFYAVLMASGLIFGVISSYIAVLRYLELKQK